MSNTPTKEQISRRKAWVKALKSGNYGQCQNRLRDGYGFCCLGVACDISNVGHWEGMEYVTGDAGSGRVCFIDEKIQKYFGFDSEAPEVNGQRLDKLNDDGVSFNDIAKIIETNMIFPYTHHSKRDSKGRFTKS